MIVSGLSDMLQIRLHMHLSIACPGHYPWGMGGDLTFLVAPLLGVQMPLYIPGWGVGI